MAATLKAIFFRTVVMLMISVEVCWSSDPPKTYGPSPPSQEDYQNYEREFQRPLAVFTERPVNVADFVLIPVVQVPSADLRMIYRPQIDSVSKTEPVVMCKSSTKSFEATPAVQVPLQQPFYLYDERTLIPFPKTVTILHGGYRMSIPVGVVVAPVPVGTLRAGPVFVTTLYAIPAGPVPAPLPARLVPWSSYPPNPSPPQYSPASPPQYSPASPPQYPPASPPQYSPASPPQYTPASPPQYSQPLHYSQASGPAPPSYYQHTEYSGTESDSRNQGQPGKLYSQAAAAAASSSSGFHNSKESPLLNQLREESEKNRNKYAPPPYNPNGPYQTVDAL